MTDEAAREDWLDQTGLIVDFSGKDDLRVWMGRFKHEEAHGGD